jgi:hypothetical protein
MGAIGDLISTLRGAITDLGSSSLGELTLVRSREALVLLVVVLLVAIGSLTLLWARGERSGRMSIVLPSLLPSERRLPISVARHLPFGLFLLGVPFFAIALAAPQTALVEEETSHPGHRITILIDASLSMNSAFSTRQLRAGNTFLANVSAAEYFVRRRMEGPYHDLVSLIQFGSRAYIVTPFTNDYENVLLSISLIGTPEEYRRFPDHGTLIMQAINRGVQLFRTFDFLKASGNLIVIFSDGQDTHAVYGDVTLDEILQEAADNSIPVYFIRTSYDQEYGDILPDRVWREAVERTGGQFFPAANEEMILEAIHEIDRLSAGRIELTRYVTRQPRFAPYAVVALALWTTALALTVGVRHFRRFP